MRDVIKGTFGSETIDMTDPVWGLDDEGEVRGSYRPSGHPGVPALILPIDWTVTYSCSASSYGMPQVILRSHDFIQNTW